MTTWLKITEHKPQDHQDVWYYFGVFDKVYKGKYVTNHDSWTDDDGVEHPYEMDCFYNLNEQGKCTGFLNDDVMFWMPYNEGDTKPQIPNCLSLSEDIHTPDRLQIKLDAMTIERMYNVVEQSNNPDLLKQLDEILHNPVLPPYYYEQDQDTN